MTVREQIQNAINTLQSLLDDSKTPYLVERLSEELPEEFLRIEVQVPANGDCDAWAYVEVTEECEPDEKWPDGYKVRLIKL